MEIKSGGSQTSKRGVERAEFLFWARQSLANAHGTIDNIVKEALRARSFLRAWESQLDAGSEEKKDWATRKERIESEKVEELRNWELEKDKYGILEKYDNQDREVLIEINAVWKQIDACEQIQEKYGLLND